MTCGIDTYSEISECGSTMTTGTTDDPYDRFGSFESPVVEPTEPSDRSVTSSDSDHSIHELMMLINTHKKFIKKSISIIQKEEKIIRDCMSMIHVWNCEIKRKSKQPTM